MVPKYNDTYVIKSFTTNSKLTLTMYLVAENSTKVTGLFLGGGLEMFSFFKHFRFFCFSFSSLESSI